MRSVGASQGNEALQHQPFASKAIGQRDSSQGQGANQGKKRSVRHVLSKATKELDILAAGTMHNAARAHEHQHLHNAVVKRMYQSGNKAQQIPVTTGQHLQQHATAEGRENNAHVFHGGISQNTLDIVFHLRIEHAKEGGYRAHQHHYHAPPVVPGGQKAEHKATKAIQRNLQHDATHQRGNMARSCGMRIGQPHMQRHQASLQSKANKGRSKNCMLPPANQLIGSHSLKAKVGTKGAGH